MTQAEYAKLVNDFKQTMERGEKDQWKLAEIAYLASEMGHGGLKQFATDTGYAYITVKKYKAVHAEVLEMDTVDIPFAEMYVLAGMSEERGEALQILAEIDGTTISTAKRETERIKQVRTFIAENQDLMAEALKDETTRKEVVGAAFVAASEDLPAEKGGRSNSGNTTAPKPKRFVAREEMLELRYKTINSGIWGKTNLPMIVEQLDKLEQYIDTSDVDVYLENLRPAKEAMDTLWAKLEQLADVKV